MRELAVLKKGRKYYPASVDRLALTEDENWIRLGNPIPLYPGPTLFQLVELEERSDPKYYDRIKQDAIKRIQRTFTEQIDVTAITQIRRRYQLMNYIVFNVLPNFAPPPKSREKEELASGGVTMNEKETINYIMTRVDNQKYRVYEERARRVLNIPSVDNVEVNLNQLSDGEKNPWGIFQEYLRKGFVSNVPTSSESLPDKGIKMSDVLKRAQGVPTKVADTKDAHVYVPNGLPSGSRGDIFLIDEPQIFQLVECPKNSTNAEINFEGRLYSRGTFFDSVILKHAIREGLRRKAIEEEKNEIIESLRRVKDEIRAKSVEDQLKLSALLMMLSEVESFEIGKFGFIKNAGYQESYKLYIHTGDYILDDLLDGTGLYYFKSCRVGIDVNLRDTSTPFIIDVYKHPALREINASGQEICLAGAPLPGKGIADRMVKRLNMGAKLMISGYTNDCGPHHHLNKVAFRDLRISPNDRRAKMAPITNRWT